MDDKGSLAFETAVVFPMFLILLVVLIIVLAKTISYEKPEVEEFIDGINKVDSIMRKASIINEIIE